MELLTVGGVTVSESDIIHDSTKAAYRSPLGAVVCGTEIELSLFTGHLPVERAFLCVCEGEASERIELYRHGGRHGGRQYHLQLVDSSRGLLTCKARFYRQKRNHVEVDFFVRRFNRAGFIFY